jgi:hypothetical protein
MAEMVASDLLAVFASLVNAVVDTPDADSKDLVDRVLAGRRLSYDDALVLSD